MFDESLPEIPALGELSARELVDAARGWARAENAAGARKLAGMAELFARRTGLAAQDREDWWVDPDAAVAAELAAALDLTQGLALAQTHRGVALRDRLPRVAALFEAGLINDILVRAIVWRTYLIDDETAMGAVDAELAEVITGWGPLSAPKVERAIDAIVDRHDPGALRRSRESGSSRTVEFGGPKDVPGITSLYARMNAADAAAMRARVEDLAHSVCEADPRSLDERRNDAFAALGLEMDSLPCQCGTEGCEAAGRRPARDTTIYVIAERAAIAEAADASDPGSTTRIDDAAQRDSEEATRDRGESAETGVTGAVEADGAGASEPDVTGAAEADGAGAGEPDAAEPDSAEPDVTGAAGCKAPKAPPAFIFGAGVTPNWLLAQVMDGARFREVLHPGITDPEPGYTPSAATAAFVRCRDLTCRFPGCDRPASLSDIDHTVPHPLGPTHPSNLKCLCRFHHLLKTFWNGPTGWRDRQLPDGTVIWTSPTGHVYTTKPGSALLFPSLCRPTGELWPSDPPESDSSDARGALMPRRRQTRAQNRIRAVAAERKLNEERAAEHNKPPPF
ncbi:HNH endonuclease signature motif containing protein [Mycolicibacterium poriferae]|uniref:HNH endonuclease signature motif containing protein n=1 Tax=Mycolicibacterium poriferae TaxID=39694 RepID=UPI0024B8FDB2|nr:HNH endonuclease signature motif containing protein [Mycolicibacterium poriferae]